MTGQESKRFSPNAIKEHEGGGNYECNVGACREKPEWDIELIDRHGVQGLVRACDEHVENFWGYHPEEQQ